MSIRRLSALVLLLVAGVIASVRCYLAVDVAAPAHSSLEACCDEDLDLPYGCDGSALATPLRDGRRLIYRSALAVRRHEAAASAQRDS